MLHMLKWAAGMLGGGLLCSGAAALPVQPPVTVIRNVQVIAMDGAPIHSSSSIVVEGPKVRSILSEGDPIPAGARIIDGHGEFVIPGLIDAHVHYPYYGVVKPADYLRYGVTTVFSLGTPTAELPELLRARAAIAQGREIGPHIYATGPAIANHIKIDKVADVEPFLSSLRFQGLEFVKVYNEIPQDVFDAVIAGAHQRGMGVFGHIPRRFPPEFTITHGLDVIAHMEELYFTVFHAPRDRDLAGMMPDWSPDYSKIDPILDLIAAHHVAIIPNLVAPMDFQDLWTDEEREYALPDAKYINPKLLQMWKGGSSVHRDQIEKRMMREQIKYPLIRTLTYRAWKKGILLLAGTDAPLPAIYPGRSLHQELRLLVAAGLPPEDALRTATANGGIVAKLYVDHNACIGVIAPGCEADLVLLKANPLEDIRNTAMIAGVMSDGRWYTPAELDRASRWTH
jgi:imidazolonepropionase-like amidohydrolase